MHPAHDDAHQESDVHEASSAAMPMVASALRVPLDIGWNQAAWVQTLQLLPFIVVSMVSGGNPGRTFQASIISIVVLAIAGALLSLNASTRIRPSDLVVTRDGLRIQGGDDDGLDEQWRDVRSVEVIRVSPQNDRGSWYEFNVAFDDDTEVTLAGAGGENEEKHKRLVVLGDLIRGLARQGQSVTGLPDPDAAPRCSAGGEETLVQLSEAMSVELSRGPSASRRRVLFRNLTNLSLLGLMSIPLLAHGGRIYDARWLVLAGLNLSYTVGLWCSVRRRISTQDFYSRLTKSVSEAVTDSLSPAKFSAVIRMHREELSRQPRVWGVVSAGFFAVSLGLLVYLLR